MSIRFKFVTILFIRITLFFVGLATFVLSFFHGTDFNLLTMIGLLMLIISLNPYESPKTITKIWGISVTVICFILYSYLLISFIENQLSSNESPTMNFIIISCYFIPLICLGYLIFHFTLLLKKPA
jgi:hypothetical protein